MPASSPQPVDRPDVEPTARSLPHLNRRTFVGASVAAGGAVTVLPLLGGCADDAPEAASTTTRVLMEVTLYRVVSVASVSMTAGSSGALM